jgi:hypothetical protein
MVLDRRQFITAMPLVGLTLTACQGRGLAVEVGKAPIVWSNFKTQYLSSAELGHLSATTSPDGKAASLLFDHMLLDFQPGSLDFSGASIFIGSFILTLPPKMGLNGYITDIRGAVIKDPDARGVVFLDIASTSKVLEWPFGEEVNKDFFDTFASVERLSADSDAGKVGASLPLEISMSLFAQRRSAKDTITITIDSLDMKVLSE